MGDSKRSELWNERIGLLPLQKPVIVSESTTIQEAISCMQKAETGCILIKGKEKALSGILTERDVMDKYIATNISPETTVKDLMSPDPKVLSADTTVAEAVEYVGAERIRHFPVGKTEGPIVGLMSVRVIVDFVSEHLATEILNLPPDSNIVARSADGG